MEKHTRTGFYSFTLQVHQITFIQEPTSMNSWQPVIQWCIGANLTHLFDKKGKATTVVSKNT